MGEARDLDILSARLKKNFQSLNTLFSEKVRIRKIIQPKMIKARRNLIEMLKSAQYKRILGDLKQIAPHRNKKRIRPEDLLNKAFNGVDWKKDISKPGEFHKVRIVLKNLRYACEFLVDFYDEKKMQKKIRDIVDVLNILGEHQDAENAVRTLIQFKIIEKTKAIDMLVEIEKGYARNALKEFKEIWKNKCRRISGAFP